MPRRPKSADLSDASKAAAIATVLATAQHRLQDAGVTARATAGVIHDDGDFDPDDDEPDLGYLCELTGELLHASAQRLLETANAMRDRYSARKLARAIEAQRTQLRRAQAVVHAMAHFLRTSQARPPAPPMLIVFTTLAATCESILDDLDPVSLGLPVPTARC